MTVINMGGRSKFWKGQIVRRKIYGRAIGPYMRIVRIEPVCVYADVIGSKESNVMLLKKNVRSYSVRSLPVSEEILERLNKGTATCVQSIMNTSWKRVLEDCPDLIRFYTRPKGCEAIFTPDSVYKTYSLGKVFVRIVVKDKIV